MSPEHASSQKPGIAFFARDQHLRHESQHLARSAWLLALEPTLRGRMPGKERGRYLTDGGWLQLLPLWQYRKRR
jgi:hypothetical protein